MLPRLAESKFTSREPKNNYEPGLLGNSQATQVEKNLKQLQLCEERFQEEMILNTKLKALYQALKDNIDSDSAHVIAEEELNSVIREKKKWINEHQHQAHLLNILISDNDKLKDQVNAERNKRAIYFNIYKNLEHQIHFWEEKYKNAILDSLKAEGVKIKIKEKFRKANKKISREISQFCKDIDQYNNLDEPEPDQEYPIRSSKPKRTFAEMILLSKAEKSQSKEHSLPIAEESLPKEEEKAKTEGEDKYEFQQRKISMTSLLDQIKRICGIEEIDEMKKYWSSLQNKIQDKFNQFREQEKKDKELSEKIRSYEAKINSISQQSWERKTTLKQLGTENERAFKLSSQIEELEKEVEQSIGMNVAELDNDMILHHCLRVKEQNSGKKEGKRNLQKFLEQSKKDKIQCSMLLSPKEMHKRVVESQAFGNENGMYNS